MTLIVEKILGTASVQDLGRGGFASHAVPRAGAMVRALARNANAALGNDERAACVEIFGRAIFRAETAARVATEDGAVRTLEADDRITIDPIASLRVRYLAIERGVDAPIVLGSRSAFMGDTLRASDRIACAKASPHDRMARTSPFDAAGPVRIVAGPDLPELAASLALHAWRISASSDRKGARLEGAVLRAMDIPASLPSSPMIVGAIQLPPSGTPIVIGPEGPTTGGYALVACIVSGDLDRFHARPLGSEVILQIVS
jgi:allophanate hydrolase subunit 2